MNVLLVYQNDPEPTETAAAMLKELGHEGQSVSAAELPGKDEEVKATDLVIVFAETYKEKETRSLCESLHQADVFQGTPLLVAVNMYQMPLANRIKALPNSYFIFTPLKKKDLEERLSMLTEPADDAENPQD